MISQHQFQEACDKLQAAEDRIEELEAQSQWISVEDRNPNFCGHYYVHCDGCDDLVEYSSISEVWKESRLFGEVTHWMPRPNPPRRGE